MKLYATTTSERASKGQGGNEYLEIEVLNVYKDVIASVSVENRKDEIYLEIRVESETGSEKEIYSIPLPKTKGKRQTGESDEIIEPWDIDPNDNKPLWE